LSCFLLGFVLRSHGAGQENGQEQGRLQAL